MTIVTKPLSEKKGEKPLVESVKVDIVQPERGGHGHHGVPLVHGGHDRHSSAQARERRVQSASTLFLFLAALCVTSCGIVAGLYLYRQYVRVQMERFHLRCNIPISFERNVDQFVQSLEDDLDKSETGDKYFHEDFEIEDNYEKITVPDFSGGRRSKFIHDFKTNMTGIIDTDGRRCFVMPLNRSLVLPPETLIDLVRKMQEGYYEVDTRYLRDNMRVIMPAVEDRASLGHYIEKECFGVPIYRLEKVVSGVYKRSAEPEVKFLEFAGKNTQELHITNYNELVEHEEQLPVAMA